MMALFNGADLDDSTNPGQIPVGAGRNEYIRKGEAFHGR
jgi:hypothetical protein